MRWDGTEISPFVDGVERDATSPRGTSRRNAGAFGSIAYNAKILIKGARGIPHFMGQIKDLPPPPPPSAWQKLKDPNP